MTRTVSGSGFRLAMWGLLILVGSHGGANAAVPTAESPRTGLWSYQAPSGVSYEFQTNSAGLISRITITGPPASFHLKSGIRLGSTYSAVLQRYGFPDKHLIRTLPTDAAQVVAGPRGRSEMETVIEYTQPIGMAFTFHADRVTHITLILGE